ncbi:hypothetical protein EDD37DRAFT_605435 [Exophiala viscosa]|uniref:F-box domain-containing protein n=1 Tax=Exophiala viscosa TaxID=2486360 RepID=A0AAN6E3I4_9EURO|nr:hypothetical protein EDD36DRAFT_413182 [Exophiala viscosa]KAI1626598.1 hypothetical protein EDD37DRAFT_605435 [Exophiala viscosa]
MTLSAFLNSRQGDNASDHSFSSQGHNFLSSTKQLRSGAMAANLNAHERPPPQPNRLSKLPGELQSHIYSYLDYPDLCNLGATSRSLRNTWTNPQSRLKKELSKAWTEIGRRCKGIYQISQPRDAVDRWLAVNHEARSYVSFARISPGIADWLVYSTDYWFPCTRCCRMTELRRFPYFLWEQSFLRYFPDVSRSKQSHEEFFETLVCGECFTKERPGYCTMLGTRRHNSYMINCVECKSTQQVDKTEMSIQMIISGFCDRCFRKINHCWYDYKTFLQQSLVKIEELEQTPAYNPQRAGLPVCSVPQEVITKLCSGKHRFIYFSSGLRVPKKGLQWTGFVKSELSRIPVMLTARERHSKEHREMEGQPEVPPNEYQVLSTLETTRVLLEGIFYFILVLCILNVVMLILGLDMAHVILN